MLLNCPSSLLIFKFILLLAIPSPATSVWPFPPKRFTGNSLVGAGSMGLDNDNRVVAFGDFNADQLCVFLEALHLEKRY